MTCCHPDNGVTPTFKALAMNTHLFSRELRQTMDDMFRPHGMSSSRWMLLAILRDASEPISQKELALRMDIESASIVRLIDALERDGWVLRQTSAYDRRIKLVSVLPKAQKFYKVFARSMQHLERALLEQLCPDRLRDAIDLLAHLRCSLQSFTEDLSAKDKSTQAAEASESV